MGFKRALKIYIKKKLLSFLGINQNEETLPVLIKSSKYLDLGINTFHNGNFKIKGENHKIKIGSYCAFGENITLLTSNHNYNYASIQYTFYRMYFEELPYKEKELKHPIIEIGNDVWIGDNVIILPNVKIGNGVCIGAGSVVTKSIEPYSIVAGVPAKIIKMRFSENTIMKLEKIKWWNFSVKEIVSKKEFFFKNLNV